jgi:hypothetical protein
MGTVWRREPAREGGGEYDGRTLQSYENSIVKLLKVFLNKKGRGRVIGGEYIQSSLYACVETLVKPFVQIQYANKNAKVK